MGYPYPNFCLCAFLGPSTCWPSGDFTNEQWAEWLNQGAEARSRFQLLKDEMNHKRV